MGRGGLRRIASVSCEVPFLLGVLLASDAALAGEWLDYLRKYDLNDYAVGVSFTTQQNPYVGAENSAFAFPVLTSFEHPEFTADWFVVRDGGMGIRRVTPGGWEFAAGGRVQTLGFGNHDSPQLRGMSEPKWSIEVGPSLGLRRWPMHIRLAAFIEPTDRHDGATSQLVFSYPIKTQRAYLVPSIAVIHQDHDYTDYYYSVAPEEATVGRPAYRTGAATNLEAALAWGYELSEQWLLSGKLSVAELDDKIRSSPIVERGQIWSVNLGLAYNADVFGSSTFDALVADEPRFNLVVGAFRDNIDSKVGRDSADGIPGDETDLEEILGASEQQDVFQFEAGWRFKRYQRIEAGYFELLRDGSEMLAGTLRFGDSLFDAGDVVNSRSHFKTFRIGYAYSLVRDAQKELGFMLGLHFTTFELALHSAATSAAEKSRADVPLPVIGAHASVNVGEKTTIAAKLQIFRTDFDQYEGSLNYFMLSAQRRIGTSTNLGIGYNYYAMKLHSSSEDLHGYFQLLHQGPVLYLGYHF